MVDYQHKQSPTRTQPTLSTIFVQPRTAPLPPRNASLPTFTSRPTPPASSAQPRSAYPVRSSSLRRGDGIPPAKAIRGGEARLGGLGGGKVQDGIEEVQRSDTTTDQTPRSSLDAAGSTKATTATSSPYLSSTPTATFPRSRRPPASSAPTPTPHLPPPRAANPQGVRFASPSPSAFLPPVQPSSPSAAPSPSCVPLGVGVDLFRLGQPAHDQSKGGNDSIRSVFEEDGGGIWRRGVGLGRARSKRREKSIEEVDQDEMEVLQGAEELAKKVVQEKGLQRSASTSDVPSAPTGLRRLFSLSNRQKSHSASSSLSSLTSLPSLSLVRKNSSAAAGDASSNRLRKPKPPSHRRAGRDDQTGRRAFGEDSPGSFIVTLDNRSRRRSASLPPSFGGNLPLPSPRQEEALDEILRIGGYGGLDSTPALATLNQSPSSRLRKQGQMERLGRVAEWREQGHVGDWSGTFAGSSYRQSCDPDKEEAPSSVVALFDDHPAPPFALSRPRTPPDVPTTPPTFSFLPRPITSPYAPTTDVPSTPTIDFTPLVPTEPLRFNRSTPAVVSFHLSDAASTARPISVSSSADSTYDPFALHIPLYSVPCEQPLASSVAPLSSTPRRLPPSSIPTHRAAESEDSLSQVRVSRVEQVLVRRQASLVRKSSVRSAKSSGVAL